MPSIVIDFDPLLALADDPVSAAWFLIANGGWFIILCFFLWTAKWLWLIHIQMQYITKKMKPVLLAIDVPKLTVQTPKGVENLIAHLAGAHGSPTRREKYLTGWAQEWFSLEIISIEGYTQFLVWTWDKYRDLMESAIYAQYPDAQIAEVQDYTTAVPGMYPNPDWELFGTEFTLTKPSGYPIRTWDQFEHKGQKDEPFKDPLSALLENLARIGPGEQIWMQFLIMPTDQRWQDAAVKVVKKLIGAKVPAPTTFMDTAFGAVGAITGPLLAQVLGPTGPEKPKREEPLSKVLYMSPGERNVVELIEKKIGKIGFKTKIRTVYIARKEVYKKPRGAHALIGAIKQFNTNDANSFRPDYKRVGMGSLFWFKDQRNNARRRKIFRAYRTRSMWIGLPPYILNTEELATLWHFPTASVHSPLIKKTEAKRAEPPTGLPIAHAAPPPSLTAADASVPDGLPVVNSP